jgi:methylenetetrahydrofolate--tRNA-(uracil-5-)-methyltransferase
MSHQPDVLVAGSGLAGSQAALTIAALGGEVELCEMRPLVQTAAHRTAHAAELVCSNSLRSNDPQSAAGLLKEELRILGCDLLRIAAEAAIPGGTALTVDRERFALNVTASLLSHPRVCLRKHHITDIPADRICILATGPLTSDPLASAVQNLTGETNLAFHDAIAPVVDAETINADLVFASSRYDKSTPDFLNCPLNESQYRAFREALMSAEGIFKHQFDELDFFGCPPIEELARRGEETLRHGPMKPVGLRDPRTGQTPYAVVQLRKENLRSDSYNMVGFQNQLRFSEQQRVFRMIPGLEQAEFMRFGQMHRNTYVRAPALLNPDLSLRRHPNVFLAGQLAGVEGYVEAMATGLIAGVQAWRRSVKLAPLELPRQTALGSICHYLAHAEVDSFAPVRFTFDLLPSPEKGMKRPERRHMQCERALNATHDLARAVNTVVAA